MSETADMIHFAVRMMDTPVGMLMTVGAMTVP
jgi:hypothetical protein